jgi:HUS1 checkpoint protein
LYSQIAVVSPSNARSAGLSLTSLSALQSSIFDVDSFRLESNNENEIYLEISTDALSRALKSAVVSSRLASLRRKPRSFAILPPLTQGATQVIIKLAKKGGQGPQGTGKGSHPVLTLSITSAVSSASSFERSITY